jgi:hypothetical protein
MTKNKTAAKGLAALPGRTEQGRARSPLRAGDKNEMAAKGLELGDKSCAGSYS